MSLSAPPHLSPRYYCHQCDRTVPIERPASRDADVFCPLCAGGFVEELEVNPNPPQQPPPPSSSYFFPSLDLRQPSDLAAFFGPPSPAATASRQFDPSNFLHDHFNGLLSGGATIQIVLEGGSPIAFGPGGVGGGGVSLGDYFVGTGLEQLLQQLAENDPNRYGTPPAAKAAVSALPDVAVSAEMMAADGGAQCAVCMDDFLLGAAAKQLPCNHVFHKDCILPWLELHSSCPVCRFELPTDDPDYEHQRGSEQPAAGGGDQHAAFDAAAAAAAAAAGTSSPRLAERRFRISLPWPLRAALGLTESSDPSSQDAGGGSGSGSGSGSGGNNNDGHRSYDDLD